MGRWGRVAALVAGTLVIGAAPAAAQECDPFGPAQLRGEVPTPKQVLGIDIGDRDVTAAEADRYVQAVDGASDRVVSGVLARTVEGRDLRYAIAGDADRVTPGGLARVRAAAAKLMDPRTSAGEARAIAARDPEILWIAGNVHGSEESGTDASLRVLWELADRADCAATTILANAVVVILPTQNPDGREADRRQNHYGFDMNRDWFARTQPETDGKVEMLRRFPPVLFIDAHERGGSNNYFFPPNADPIYHEITDQAVSWIDDYGAANRAVFEARGIPYFNYDVYDLFYMGYGDTVPATGFGAAGMTYEKSNQDAASVRDYQQYLTQWNTLFRAATRKADILTGWHDGWVTAEQEGEAGKLEPNEVVQPENTVQTPVPDITVRQYFLRAGGPPVKRLIRRLQRMDVEVRRLDRPAVVDDFTPYGRATRRERFDRGDYVISMAQRQKHWVQAMLNEDTYVPFPYFYDVTGWSQPMLFDVAGGYSGAPLHARTSVVPPVRDPGVERVRHQPRVALYSMSPQFQRGIESGGWLSWLLDHWGIRYRSVTAEDIKAGALRGADVLLVPDGYAELDPDAPDDPYGVADLGDEGRRALRHWVRHGGRYVGWLDGALLASDLGLSSASFESAEGAGISSPGALFRIAVDPRDEVGRGLGRFAWAFWDSRFVMRANGAPVAASFPAAGTEDFFVSGYADGADALGGTPAVLDERYGRGRTIAFSFEPNFRAFTDGTQVMLRNAILGRGRARHGHGHRAVIASRARLAAPHSPVRVVVKRRGAHAAQAVLDRLGLAYRVERSKRRVAYAIAYADAGAERPQWTDDLGAALRDGRVPVVMYRVP
jgi:Zinc carboxypeptidase